LVSDANAKISSEINTISSGTPETTEPKAIETIAPIVQQAPIQGPEALDLKAPEAKKESSSVGQGTARPPGYGTTGGVETVDAPPKLDYGETEAKAEEIKQDEIQRALQQESIDQQNIKNAFSHLLAQGKDSGFVNAKNMVAVRSAALRRYDTVSGAEMRFNQTIMDLSKEQERENFAFDKEQYTETATMHKNVIDNLLSANDLDGAIEYAEMLGGEYGSSFVLSETWQKSARALQDDALKAEIYGEGGTADRLWSLAMNAVGVNAGHNATRMRDMINENAEAMGTFAVDTFGSIPEGEYEAYGIDGADQIIVDEFLSGKRDMNDPEVIDVLIDTMINQEQKLFKDQEIERLFGEQSQKYLNDPTTGPLYQAILDEYKDDDSTILIGEDQFSTYGIEIDGRNIENMLGIGNKVQNWDFEPYDDQNPRNPSEIVSFGVDENGDPAFPYDLSNGQLDEMHDAYHRKMMAEYKAISDPVKRQEFRGTLLNQRAFKEKLENEMRSNSVNEKNIGDIMISGDTASEYGKDTVRDTLIELTGETNLTVANEAAAKVVFEAIQEDKTPSSSYVNQIENDVLNSIAEEGHIAYDTEFSLDGGNQSIKTSPSGKKDLLPADSNNNMFTGAGMNDLLGRLDDSGRALVMLGGEPHFVQASSYGWKKEGGGMPTIKWEIYPTNDDKDNATVLYGEVTGPNGEEVRVDQMSNYAEQVLVNRSLSGMDTDFYENASRRTDGDRQDARDRTEVTGRSI